MSVGATPAARRATFDPRPVVEEGPGGHVVVGGRCVACGHPSATTAPRCARCGAETAQARFGPEGVVWATTTIRVASGDRPAPYTLAYVDLNDGPRVLVHVQDGPELAPRVAETVRLNGTTDLGDPRAELAR